MIENQKPLPIVPSLIFVAAYVAVWIFRQTNWLPKSWSVIPVIETAWLPFLIVIGIIIWMVQQKISLANVGLQSFQPSRSLFTLTIGTMAIDFFAIALTTPAVESIFGSSSEVVRFQELPGNLPLLFLVILLSWLIAGFGEEFFFRGFLLTVVAKILGGPRTAWFLAVVIQAIGFGLIHLEQGPAQMIYIGIGGAVFGASYLYSKKNLWPVILAHGINNTLGFVLLYFGAIAR